MSFEYQAVIPMHTDPGEISTLLDKVKPVYTTSDAPFEEGVAFDDALMATRSMIHSGVLGHCSGGEWHITITGSCTPENQGKPGLADDNVVITIVKKGPRGRVHEGSVKVNRKDS